MNKKIIYIQYSNPAAYPPLEHSSSILALRGWHVLFLGTRGLLGASKLKFTMRENVKVQLISFCGAGWRQKLHYFIFCIWVIFRVFSWRPQLVYVSDYLSAPVGLFIACLPNIRVIYHEHDSPELNPTSLFMIVVLIARRWLAKRAAVCILPNEQRKEIFARSLGCGKKVICVWNCPRIEEVVPSRKEYSGGKFWVYYHGSLGPSRLPFSVIKALSLLPAQVYLRIIGYEVVGNMDYAKELFIEATRIGVSKRVVLSGATSFRHEALLYCQQADIGLSLMPKEPENINMRYMVGASNKPFDYLACGLALLVSDIPDWQKMFVDPGYALSCDPDSPESIAQALNWFLEHPDGMRKMGELGRQKILSEWNYELQFKSVLSSGFLRRDIK